MTSLELEKNQAFQTIWKECRAKIANSSFKVDNIYTDYSKQIDRASSETACFHNFLSNIPVIVTIIYWVKQNITDKFWSTSVSPKIVKLLKSELVPIKNPNGELVLLSYFIKEGHKEILESIRCVNGWSLLEKEDIIQCYLQFTHSLEKQTLGTVSHGLDPDRERVRYREVNYEQFIEFVQYLPERDALIAKLLF